VALPIRCCRHQQSEAENGSAVRIHAARGGEHCRFGPYANSSQAAQVGTGCAGCTQFKEERGEDIGRAAQ
jgi:hypothetical protein